MKYPMNQSKQISKKINEQAGAELCQAQAKPEQSQAKVRLLEEMVQDELDDLDELKNRDHLDEHSNKKALLKSYSFKRPVGP